MTTGLRIGIDVGGTNTDAVLMRGRTVLAQLKSATTRDVTSGIETALRGLSAAVEDAGAPVAAVMIGTTHFTNAFVDARELTPCGVIRLCLPATAAVPPFEDWPASLVEAIGGHAAPCSGGRGFDRRPAPALGPPARRRAGAGVRPRG